MIEILSSQIKQIETHAVKTYPEECCGLLLGENTTEKKLVKQVWPTDNSWDSEIYSDIAASKGKNTSKRNRFSISPLDILTAQKQARSKNWNIIGIYHSHPDNLPIPSEFDRAIAHHCYSYLIISLASSKTLAIRSWQLDDHNQWLEENMIITTVKKL